jgi:hypothetical protein
MRLSKSASTGLALNEATARSCRIGAADRARPGHHDWKAAPDSGLMLPVTAWSGGLMRPGLSIRWALEAKAAGTGYRVIAAVLRRPRSLCQVRHE